MHIIAPVIKSIMNLLNPVIDSDKVNNKIIKTIFYGESSSVLHNNL